MGLIQTQYNDRVRYILTSDSLGFQLIEEPNGWNEDEKEYSRNKDFAGIVSKFSNNLKFYKNGAVYLTTIYNSLGVNAEVRLYKEVRHPETDIWTKAYDGYLDFSTFSIENKIVSIKFNSGSLIKTLKSRLSEKVELQRDTTLSGNSLDELSTVTVDLQGRDIFLKSTFNNDNSEKELNFEVFSSSGGIRYGENAIPVNVDISSHEEAFNVSVGTQNTVDASGVFFGVSQEYRELDLTIQLSLDYYANYLGSKDNNWVYVHLVRLDSSFNELQSWELYGRQNIPAFLSSQVSESLSIDTNLSVSINEGDSLRLRFRYTHDFPNSISDINAICRVFNIDCSINIDEASSTDNTTTKAVLPYELFERITAIISDSSIKSNALNRVDLGADEDGEFSLLSTSHGFWIRNFYKDDTDEENKYKDFTTSLKDAIQSYYSLCRLTLGVETNGFNEHVVIEDKNYFFNKNITLRLGQVTNVKRYPNKDIIYSSIETGYNNTGEYEEASGLDEYNVKNVFTSPITALSKTLDLKSKFRGDSYGKEFARRKQRVDFPTEDTNYDKEIFFSDLKRGTTNFEERIYSDDFTVEPTNVYSPTTATMLRFTPRNILLRHSDWIASGLDKNTNDVINYTSSEGNSSITTEGVADNADINVSDLSRARATSDIIEFEYPLDFELLQSIEGSTVVKGATVQNFYGLVEFTNEYGIQETGWIMSLKPNKEGKWKLLKNNF